jgi:branched-chain amino acid aminotransferase
MPVLLSNESSLQSQKPGWDDDLAFGYREVDAFWLTRWTPESGWEEGQLYEHQGATLELSLAANVLHYGQAIFEGLKARRTKQDRLVLFRPAENARRMRTSAARLVMQAPPVSMFLEAVEQVVRTNARWVPGYRKGTFYLRPLLIGSGEVLGVSPAKEYTFTVFGCPAGKYMGGSRVIVLPSVHRAAPHGTGAAKAAGNYAASLRPHEAARQMGYTDALYLDAREDRYVEELGAANFFVILDDGTLITPQLGSILPGVTRASVLSIARELFGWIAVERPLAIDEVLEHAVEAFYTGTAAVLAPVTEISYQGQDYVIGDGKPGPKATQLLEALDEIQLQERPDLWDWVLEVEV